MIALATVATASAQIEIPDYVRGSIYSIRLDAPSTSKEDFSRETAIMVNVFDTLDYANVYRKYNAFNAGERMMASTDLPEASADEIAAIAAINGKKKPNKEDEYAAQVLKKLNADNVGRALVAKWFSTPETTDYSKLTYDQTYQTILKWGLMSLSEDEKAANKQSEMSNTDVALGMADQLLNSTYVLVTKYDFATPAEQIQDQINEKLAPLYDKLAKAPAMLKETIQGTIDSQIESLKQTLQETVKLNAVSARSYLYKLKWTSEADFQKYVADPASFESASEFQLEYVTTTKGTNVLVTSIGGEAINVDKTIARASLKVLNKNVNRLAQQYEPFAPIERLYSENDQLYVKIGTQEGVNKDSKFTALKKDAKTNSLVPAGTLSVAKGGLWNNNKDAEDIEANADASSTATYTKLDGKIKGCSYVRFGGNKKK